MTSQNHLEHVLRDFCAHSTFAAAPKVPWVFTSAPGKKWAQPTHIVLQVLLPERGCGHLQGVHEVEGERAADGEGEHAGDDEEHFADEAAPHRLIPEISGPLGSLCAQ